MLTKELNGKTKARILERQSTFVRFVTKDLSQYKIHYLGKTEYLLEEPEFVGVTITEDHPILKHYQENKVVIYISSKARDPKQIFRIFEAMVHSEYEGWRNMNECFNPDFDIVSLLEGGHGMLFSGPESLSKEVIKVLQNNGIRFKSMKPIMKEQIQVFALLMGGNIVVAKGFRVERIQS